MAIVGLLIAFILQIVFFVTPQPVRAQDANTGTPVEATFAVYIPQLESYRTKESRFIIAREQYRQVQTLASLEEVVKASKEVQLARIDVLMTYFNMLREAVGALKGAEVTKKMEQSNRLLTITTELGVLRQQIQDSNDRIALDNISAQYQNRHIAYISAAYSALSLIRIANIQSATDQLGLLTSQVFASIQESSPSATVFAEKQRGYDELARTITQIKEILSNATTRTEPLGVEEFTANTYTQIVDILSSAFTKLQLAESFLKELAK